MGLPPNWEVRHSQSKNLPYYFNAAEKNSRWEPPAGTDTEKLKLYMAKYHSSSLVAEGAQPGKIRAAHLLVKHKESRRPSSWREVSIHQPLGDLQPCHHHTPHTTTTNTRVGYEGNRSWLTRCENNYRLRLPVAKTTRGRSSRVTSSRSRAAR